MKCLRNNKPKQHSHKGAAKRCYKNTALRRSKTLFRKKYSHKGAAKRCYKNNTAIRRSKTLLHNNTATKAQHTTVIHRTKYTNQIIMLRKTLVTTNS